MRRVLRLCARAQEGGGCGLRRLRRLWRCRRGATLVFYALGASAFLSLAGTTLEIARYSNLRSRMVSAMDAAALAGSYGRDRAERLLIARRVFAANFPHERLGISPPQVEQFDARERGLTTEAALGFEAAVEMPLLFGGLFGVPTFPVERQVLVVQPSIIEVAVVLDVSRSMFANPADPGCVGELGRVCPRRFEAMQQAVNDFLGLAYGGGEEGGSIHMSLVFFAGGVNVGSRQRALLLAESGNGALINPLPYDYPNFGSEVEPDLAAGEQIPQAQAFHSNCMKARIRPNPQLRAVTDAPREDIDFEDMVDINDTPAGTGEHERFTLVPGATRVTNPRGEQRNLLLDNLGPLCLDRPGEEAGAGHAIVQLTNDPVRLRAVVNNLEPRLSTFAGGTLIVSGVAWALRALSPRWQGLWSDISDPYTPRRTTRWAEGAANPEEFRRTDKYIILFSDGNTEVRALEAPVSTPYGFGMYNDCAFHEDPALPYAQQHCPLFPPPYYDFSPDGTPRPGVPEEAPHLRDRSVYITGRGNVLAIPGQVEWPAGSGILRDTYEPLLPEDGRYVSNDIDDDDDALQEFEDRLFHDLCPVLAARGVEVFTIGYIDGDPGECATAEANRALATDADSLRAAFRSVAERIFRSRIVEVGENF